MSKISVFSLEKRFKQFEKPVFSVAAKLLKIINSDNYYLEIYLADGKTMRFLNKKFRNKNKTANVLSFNEPSGFPHPELAVRNGMEKTKSLGEIYLNLEDNERITGKNVNKSPDENFRLLAHGILHLLGYNHKKKNDKIKMEVLEKKLISEL